MQEKSTKGQKKNMRKPVRKLAAGVAVLATLGGVGLGLINGIRNTTAEKAEKPKTLTIQKVEQSAEPAEVKNYKLVSPQNIIAAYRRPFNWQKGRRVMLLGQVDSMGRATGAHIQVTEKDLPNEKRQAYLTVNPAGWHNYKFKYKGKTVWLMNRGHLVGYQFSGLNDVRENLIAETAYLNQGATGGMDDKNQKAMLYYENGLRKWLEKNPGASLDYAVTPAYKGKNLVASYVILSYTGYSKSGKRMTIKLGSKYEQTKNKETSVVLENKSPQASINYATGTAKVKNN